MGQRFRIEFVDLPHPAFGDAELSEECGGLGTRIGPDHAGQGITGQGITGQGIAGFRDPSAQQRESRFGQRGHGSPPSVEVAVVVECCARRASQSRATGMSRPSAHSRAWSWKCSEPGSPEAPSGTTQRLACGSERSQT